MMTIKITVPITAPCWNCADLPLVAGSGQAPIQLIRGANQGEVGKRLGKVPQVFAAWPQLRSPPRHSGRPKVGAATSEL